MSLILSTTMLGFISHYGSEVGFLSLLCLFVACLPFFFDGAMSIISIGKNRVLTASTSTIEEVPQEEDDYQK
jgi:hypothetical protein